MEILINYLVSGVGNLNYYKIIPRSPPHSDFTLKGALWSKFVRISIHIQVSLIVSRSNFNDRELKHYDVFNGNEDARIP